MPVMTTYAGAMPNAAMKPAPASAPPTLAESIVVREIDIADTRCTAGTVAPTSALRMPMSDGRTRPETAATISTSVGSRRPETASARITDAQTAYARRMPASTLRSPSRSASTPIRGDSSVPTNCSAPNTVSSSTDPLSTSTYQPRMIVSISSAQAVHRSAGHWNR